MGGLFVQVELVHQQRNGMRRRQGDDAARQRSDRAPELGGTPRAVAVPEGHLAALPRRWRHEDTVVRDLLDAPTGRSQEKDVSYFRLEDHLLVQLAETP